MPIDCSSYMLDPTYKLLTSNYKISTLYSLTSWQGSHIWYQCQHHYELMTRAEKRDPVAIPSLQYLRANTVIQVHKLGNIHKKQPKGSSQGDVNWDRCPNLDALDAPVHTFPYGTQHTQNVCQGCHMDFGFMVSCAFEDITMSQALHVFKSFNLGI